MGDTKQLLTPWLSDQRGHETRACLMTGEMKVFICGLQYYVILFLSVYTLYRPLSAVRRFGVCQDKKTSRSAACTRALDLLPSSFKMFFGRVPSLGVIECRKQFLFSIWRHSFHQTMRLECVKRKPVLKYPWRIIYLLKIYARMDILILVSMPCLCTSDVCLCFLKCEYFNVYFTVDTWNPEGS